MLNRFPKIQYSPTPAGTINAKYSEKAVRKAAMPQRPRAPDSFWSTFALFWQTDSRRDEPPEMTGTSRYASITSSVGT